MPSEFKAWTVGAFIAVVLLGFGMLFGAIAMAVYGDPAPFLQSISGVQGIIAAVIALIAAGIAFKSQKLKVEFDERTRLEDRESLATAYLQELPGRALEVLSRVQALYATLKSSDDTKQIELPFIAASIRADIAAAGDFVARVWRDIAKLDQAGRDQILEEMRAFEIVYRNLDLVCRQMEHAKSYDGARRAFGSIRENCATLMRTAYKGGPHLRAAARSAVDPLWKPSDPFDPEVEWR